MRRTPLRCFMRVTTYVLKKSENDGPPSGFEHVGKVVAPSAQTGTHFSMQEAEILASKKTHTSQRRQRLWRRGVVVVIVYGIVHSFVLGKRAWNSRFGASEYSKAKYEVLLSTVARHDNNESPRNAAHVIYDTTSHVARFVTAEGTVSGKVQILDFHKLEQDVESVGADCRVLPVSYVPWGTLFLLCLIPIMGMVYSRISVALAHETTEAASRFVVKTSTNITTRLADVAGMTETKQEVKEVIDFMKHPDKYVSLGAKLPKGVLLSGPPGVGKTLLAKAIAGESGVSFISCSGSEFDEVFVGVGAQRMRQLFSAARAARPCVVFIDEIDAFGKKRGQVGGSRGTLNAFLNEVDGFHDATGILVLAATNRADVLDPAMTRSGRFDRKITLELPTHGERVEISKVHLRPLTFDPNVPKDAASELLASQTPGCSGADIYNICNEGAIIAARENQNFLTWDYLQRAIDKVVVGLERKAKQTTDIERQRLAHYEAGLVVVAWFLPFADPILKATIAPRGDRLVSTRRLPQEVRISTQERLREGMIQKLGGYIAEQHFFGDISSYAANDLHQVTHAAWREVCTYGMCPSEVGHVGYVFDRQNSIKKPYGPRLENAIDRQVGRIVMECKERAKSLVTTHLQAIRVVAGALLKEESLSAHQLWVLLGDRPNMSTEFRKYLESM